MERSRFQEERTKRMADANQRAEDLARRFEEANAQLIATIEGCPDDRWFVQCEDGGRTVAIVAHHVASGHVPIAEWVQSLAAGQPVSVAPDMIHRANDAHALRFANVSRDDTVDLLRTTGQQAADIVRGLTDEQLERSAPVAILGGNEVRAIDLAERILIGHINAHVADIRAAIAD